MYDVKVAKKELRGRVQKNRDSHREAFEKAIAQYREAVILELEEHIANAKAGKRIVRNSVLIEPADHTSEYDQILDMIDMSVDEVIELDAMQFRQFVRDEWDWKRQFAQSILANTAYVSSKMA